MVISDDELLDFGRVVSVYHNVRHEGCGEAELLLSVGGFTSFGTFEGSIVRLSLRPSTFIVTPPPFQG